MIGETELATRQAASQRGFFRALAGGSEGAQLVELPGGVQATLAPVRPWFSIFNSTLYLDGRGLAEALPALERAYADAGVKSWTVWVPPEDAQTPELLRGAGHLLDSSPLRMGARIDALDLTTDLDLDLEPDPTWEAVARCNDRAHGVLDDWTMSAVFTEMDDPTAHLHVARLAGEPAAALIAREQGGDCYLWFVATVPEARGRGLAAELVRTALREAAGRGCETTTLESTRMAESLYARLGYVALGRYGMWERSAS